MTTATSVSSSTSDRLEPFRELGQEAGVRRLVERFYAVMDNDSDSRQIRDMHDADLSPQPHRIDVRQLEFVGEVRERKHRRRNRHAALAHRRRPLRDR